MFRKDAMNIELHAYRQTYKITGNTRSIETQSNGFAVNPKPQQNHLAA